MLKTRLRCERISDGEIIVAYEYLMSHSDNGGDSGEELGELFANALVATAFPDCELRSNICIKLIDILGKGVADDEYIAPIKLAATACEMMDRLDPDVELRLLEQLTDHVAEFINTKIAPLVRGVKSGDNK